MPCPSQCPEKPGYLLTLSYPLTLTSPAMGRGKTIHLNFSHLISVRLFFRQPAVLCEANAVLPEFYLYLQGAVQPVSPLPFSRPRHPPGRLSRFLFARRAS